MTPRGWIVAVVVSFALIGCGGRSGGVPPGGGGGGGGGGAGGGLRPLAVSGSHLVDDSGHIVTLHGVNVHGTQWDCVQQRPQIFGFPHDAAFAAGIASWKANAVRIPLNEDCWLGDPALDPSVSGPSYQQAIEAFVATLHAAGLYAILDLQVVRVGTPFANDQPPMADAARSALFWQSLASAFRSDGAVVFDAYNEPFLDGSNVVLLGSSGGPAPSAWDCWRDGCAVQWTKSQQDVRTYQALGMQGLVDAIRGTGATQPIVLSGLAYANRLGGWSAHVPNDPRNGLTAGFHNYKGEACDATCWSNTIGPLASSYPVLTTEMGEMDCNTDYVGPYMNWADTQNGSVSYLAWKWTVNGGSSSSCGNDSLGMIYDWSGSPTPYGAGIRLHFLQ